MGRVIKPKPEKLIEHEILVWLNSQPGCFAFKVATNGYFDAKRKIFRKNTSRYLVKGTADILCCWNGRFIGIEVKSEAGLRKYERYPGLHERNQRAFATKVMDCLGRAVVVSSLDDLLVLIAKWPELYSQWAMHTTTEYKV